VAVTSPWHPHRWSRPRCAGDRHRRAAETEPHLHPARGGRSYVGATPRICS